MGLIFGRLRSELIGLMRQKLNWGDKMVTMVTWQTVVRIMLIIAMASLNWW